MAGRIVRSSVPQNVPGEIIVDGSLDFSGGVDSVKVTTIASQQNPNGLARSELAWLDNAGVRDGGITPRNGWQLNQPLNNGGVLYQGGFMYEPDNANPYLILCFSGQVYEVVPDSPNLLVNLSAIFSVSLPAAQPHYYFSQAELFLIIQAGDGVTLPLIWDGAILRRSRGLITNAPAIAFSVNLTNVNVTAGTVFQAQSGINNPLGVPYASFTAGVIGGTQTVPLLAAYAGNVGDTINYASSGTGTMTLTSITNVAGGHNYNYTNNSIPQGASVPAQFAPGNNPGTGRNFPAFTAPAIGANITFFSSSILLNPGITNTLTYTSNLTFTVAAISGTQQQAQSLISEIPAATAMDYYMGRLWYLQGKSVSAGDIVYGSSGTAAYNFRDAVLKVTENPLVLAGDGFALPSNAGNGTALFHNANLNTQLGQGQLFIGTSRAVYALQVPVTRADWIAATNQNQPLMTVVQLVNGPVNDRSVVANNGDIFYQSLEPGIRSLFSSIRYFNQWGNTQISANEQRLLDFVNRALMIGSSAIVFDNRLLQATLPVQKPQGIVNQAVVPMDFIPISQFGANTEPVWEGMWEGFDTFQMFRGDFGGLERAFSVILSRIDGSIQLYEITNYLRDDMNTTGEARVTMIIEFPAYTWGKEFFLKKLASAELWVDSVYGKVDFQMDFRPDGDPCYRPWHKWEICSARNSCEDVLNPQCYPLTTYRETYAQTMTLPLPPENCETISGRPSNVLYQCQTRLTITGWCRVRGIMLKAYPVERKLYDNLQC